MGLTQETDYALRVILYLSKLEKGTIVSANTISEKENIPLRFLLKLLRKLRDAKLDVIQDGLKVLWNPDEDSKALCFEFGKNFVEKL